MNKLIVVLLISIFSTSVFANELDVFFHDIPLNSSVVKIECYTDGISSQTLRLDNFSILQNDQKNWMIAMTVDGMSVKRTISDYKILSSMNEKRIDVFGIGPTVSLVYNGSFATLVVLDYIPRWNQEDAKRECFYFGNKF